MGSKRRKMFVTSRREVVWIPAVATECFNWFAFNLRKDLRRSAGKALCSFGLFQILEAFTATNATNPQRSRRYDEVKDSF